MDIFQYIEKQRPIKFTSVVKNLLVFQNLDQPVVIAQFDKTRIPKLEEYARSDAYAAQLVNAEDADERKLFWGTHYMSREHFKFTEGDRLAIEYIIEFYRKDKGKFKRSLDSQHTEESNEIPHDTEVDKELDVDYVEEDNKLLQKLQESKAEMSQFIKEKLKDVTVNRIPTKGTHFRCPICSRNIKLNKINGYWQITNFIKHISKHGDTSEKDRSSRKRKSTDSTDSFESGSSQSGSRSPPLAISQDTHSTGATLSSPATPQRDLPPSPPPNHTSPILQTSTRPTTPATPYFTSRQPTPFFASPSHPSLMLSPAHSSTTVPQPGLPIPPSGFPIPPRPLSFTPLPPTDFPIPSLSSFPTQATSSFSALLPPSYPPLQSLENSPYIYDMLRQDVHKQSVQPMQGENQSIVKSHSLMGDQFYRHQLEQTQSAASLYPEYSTDENSNIHSHNIFNLLNKGHLDDENQLNKDGTLTKL